jgi:predicted Rossmann-fold nucleotide-binding protein
MPEPSEFFNLVVYTGFGFTGSDLLMTRSSDAVIFGCGRLGTVHEFTLAFTEGKIIGVLEGDWGTDELIREILRADVTRPHDTIVFDSDPNRLVEQIIKKVKDMKEKK